MLKIINEDYIDHKKCNINELKPNDFFTLLDKSLCVFIGKSQRNTSVSNFDNVFYYNFFTKKLMPIDESIETLVIKCSRTEIYYKTLEI